MPEKDESRSGPTPFWSGTISFGLVSVPVGLISANRPSQVSLRMLDEDGTPLSREYYCPKDERRIDDDEIVRGYETDGGEFVVVTDEELEGLEPEKSRDIDLRQFVERDSVDPIYFERGYFLAPTGDSTKAYRLLAQAMEDSDQAGIGTFVMRDREHLVAIFSESGILRAEILRFADETREVDDIGLPRESKPDRDTVRDIVSGIEDLEAEDFDVDELEDPEAERLLELVEKKRKAKKDVVEAPEAADGEKDARVVDLMEALQRRMRGEEGGDGDGGKQDLESRTKSELYELAQERDIEGRSRMTKKELVRALRR